MRHRPECLMTTGCEARSGCATSQVLNSDGETFLQEALVTLEARAKGESGPALPNASICA